jgi:alkylation response protein AidB-like acyl-CoA dehydrogenase
LLLDFSLYCSDELSQYDYFAVTTNKPMSRKYYSKENLKFLLYDVHQCEQLLQYPYFSDHDRASFDLFLDATEDVANEHFLPIFTEMDRQEPQLKDGRIRVHSNMRQIMRLMGEGGWISSAASKEVGGNQLPSTIMYMSSFIMGCANYSVTAFPYLSMGSAHLIESFGSEDQKKTYIPKMFSGEWQGTMALTEPGAGSSLSDLVTSAEPTDAGYYKIKGHKIFISCGDHDAVDNVVHLMLARIKGAPAGTKGISMFIVPRERITAEGALEFNDVTTAGLYHKMGYKGAPIAHLAIGENDDCRGWLVGEAHKGLSYMFQMMNEARISVGLHATSISTAAYYASLQYTRERSQGRPLSSKSPEQAPVPIVQHPDVRRMLLAQKAFVEAALSLEIQCSMYEDLRRVTTPEEKERYTLLLDLLTPVAKSYPSETGCLSTSWALQCLGGYGYTTDFPLEQYYREVRIHPIHEGATGIHGLDLLGRKVLMKHGQATLLLMQEVMKEIAKAKQNTSTSAAAETMEQHLQTLQNTTMRLMGIAQKEGPEAFLADATLFLELFGIMVMGWQWLKIANVAVQNLQERPDDSFLSGKITCLNYFFEYEMIKVKSLSKRLTSPVRITTQLNEAELD